MEWREFDRAALEQAGDMGLAGRATAEEVNRSIRIAKGGREIVGLTVLGSWIAFGLLVEVTPKAAQAEENERGIPKEIEALEAKVSSLEQTIFALQGQINSLQTSNTTLQGKVNALQTQLAAVKSNPALGLGPFVSVDPNPEVGVAGPHITFKGANIHIVSGSGATDDHGNPTGLGNLIIGYDEDPINPLPGDSSLGLPTIMQTSGFPFRLGPGDRGGSHNLVIGAGNRFTQAAFGGFVAGERNTINNFGASVCGGFFSSASGLFSSVSGGIRNTASGLFSSVNSGALNIASGIDGSVSGGLENSASGTVASVVCGSYNVSSGFFTCVIGGNGNVNNGAFSVVIGDQ